MPKSPTKYLESRPTTATIRLGGRHINIVKIGKGEGMDPGYLSRIFSGQSTPSIPYGRRLADALGMTLDDLLACIEERLDKDVLAARQRLSHNSEHSL